MLKKINLYEDKGAVYWRIASHFEAEKKYENKYDHRTHIRHSQYKNLEYSGKEINYWCIKQQRNVRPRKNIRWQKHCEGVKKTPETRVIYITNILHGAMVNVSQFTFRRWLREQKYRGHKTRYKQLINSKNLKAIMEFVRKYRDQWQKFPKKVLWTDVPKVNLYPSVGNAKVWGNDLLMIWSRHDYLRRIVEAVSWLVLAWLILEETHSYLFTL